MRGDKVVNSILPLVFSIWRSYGKTDSEFY